LVYPETRITYVERENRDDLERERPLTANK
jgi:hypothetical protein